MGCPALRVQLLPGIRHGWLVQHIDNETLKAAAAAGVHGIYPRANAATAVATAAALAAGFSVRAWGVKNVEVSGYEHICRAACQGNTMAQMAQAIATSAYLLAYDG